MQKRAHCALSALVFRLINNKPEKKILTIKILNKMKKVLLIAGFALCASFAFAQTPKLKPNCQAEQQRAVATQPQAKAQRNHVDYKASIFTKDATAISTFDFSDATGLVFDKVTSTSVTGADVNCAPAHVNGKPGSMWQRLPNLAALSTLDTVNYRFLWVNDSVFQANLQYMSDNGFVVIDPVDAARQPEDQAALINSYVQLPAMSTGSATMVDINFNQWYELCYVSCFVDYLKGGVWYPVEVNVEGIDGSAWSMADSNYTVTMPADAIVNGNITIRFRLSGQHDGVNDEIGFGYGWIVDDVKVFATPAVRWSFNNETYFDGFYGLVPEGFELPLSFAVSVRNTGAATLTNVKLNVKHRYVDGAETEFTNLFSVDQDPISNNPSARQWLLINERGFMVDSLSFDDFNDMIDQTTAINYETYGADADTILAYTDYELRHLPCEGAGRHQFCITVTASANGETMEYSFDTITYNVTSMIGGQHLDSLVGLTVPGYRWGHDNGLIPSGATFSYQFANGGGVTSSGTHHTSAGYYADLAFKTPSRIPTETVDGEEEPWVFRGMEIIPSTRGNALAADFAGARIAPEIVMWSQPQGYEASLYNYIAESMLGVSSYEIEGRSCVLAADTVSYRGINKTGASAGTLETRYNAVNILFPEQPEIYPSWGYMFGYELEQGLFAAARQRSAYVNPANTDSIVYYRDDAVLADYAHQFSPRRMVYEGLAHDPVRNQTVSGWNWDWYPMIRMIVGPKMNLPKAGIHIECDEFGTGDQTTTYTPYRRGVGVICNEEGEADSVAKGGSYSYYIYPGYPEEDNDEYVWGNSVIDYIEVDGEKIWDRFDDPQYAEQDSLAILRNPNITRFDYSCVNPDHDGLDAQGNPNNEVVWPVLLKRFGYIVYFTDVQENHTIKAHTVYRPLGINDVEESRVSLSLSPNPASSQVRMALDGITGKVNCNIIDMSGRVIYTDSFNAEKEHVISLNNIPAGAYFVRVTGDTFSKVEKLIVK